MKDQDKTQEQLLQEADDKHPLAELRLRLAQLEAAEAGRKQAEEETKRAANALTWLIDTANALIFWTDIHGLVNVWNQAAVNITGYTKQEVLGRDLVEDLITEDYQAAVKAVLDKALQGEEKANFEFPLYTKGGERVMVLLNATTRRDAKGNIAGVLGIGQDITELDAYRSEVERVADDLTRLIDTANAPIFGIDTHGLVNEWNKTAVRITGYTKLEVLGRDMVEDFITEDYQAAVKEVLDKALQGEETANYEFPLYTKGGERVMVLLNATTRRDAKGNVSGVVGVGQDITELDAYRSEVERVADDLTMLIDTANAPIFGIDTHGLVNEWNKTAIRITGFDKDEVLGRALVEEFITVDYQAAVKAVLDKALQGEETANYEFPLYTKGGERVMVLLNATTRRDAKGNVSGVVGVGQDITERKRAEEALAKRTHDLGERVKELNCLYGISELVEKPDIASEEIIQGTVNLIPSAWQYPEITCARVILEGEEFRTEDFRETTWKQASDIVVHGQRIGAVEVYYLEERPESDEGPFLEQERALISAIAARLGETIERKQAEDALRESQERLARFMNAATDSFALWDSELNLIEANEAALQMLRLGKEDAIGQNLLDMAPNVKETGRYDQYMEVIKTGEPFSVDDLVPHPRFGDMHLALHAFKAGDGLGIVATDITARKQVEQMKDDFISTVSHELRTPLASIMGFTELILSGQPGELTPTQREFLDISYQSSQRLLHLVEDLLAVSRIEAGRLQLSFELLRMERLVASIMEAIKPLAGNKGIALSAEAPAQLPSLEGDRNRLEQVMNNLLSNALKFTPEGGRVAISLAGEDDHIKVGVADTGVGIPPDELARLFQKFSRASNAAARAVEGTGLGLYISRAIVERHGGRIWAESEPGKGSTFWFTLPLRQVKPAELRQEELARDIAARFFESSE